MKDNFTVQLSVGDYLRACRFHVRNIFFRPKIIISVSALCMPYICMRAFPKLASAYPYIFTAAAIPAIFTICAILGLGIFYVFLPWRTRLVFRQNKLLQQESAVEIGADGIIITSAKAQTNLDYNLVYQWAGNNDALMLYLDEHQFYILPARNMTEKQYFRIVQGLQASDCRSLGYRRK